MGYSDFSVFQENSCQMESFEAVKVVYGRILEKESENVARKIIGYIYLQDHADREMIRLAFGPDFLIQNVIQKAKIHLNLVSRPVVSPPISPSLQFAPIPLRSPRPIPSPASLQIPVPVSRPQWESSLVYQNLVPYDFGYQIQDQFTGLGDQCEPLDISSLPGDYCHPASPVENFSLRARREEYPIKVCHYFNKGHCKHGNNCKFFHGQSFPDSPRSFDFNSNEIAADDQAAYSPGSLEKLEFEITEILKSRRGNPISIASLPMIYYETYGRSLQAEGYLTESRRHGKAGYSLTKLLARLKNSIQLIDRPHGQHSIILAEDAPKYMENRYERNNPGPIVSGSRQIYLTFPAESTFTEEEVANYFSTFGPVQDVRIPCQQRRMFGFVTFTDAETVQIILSKGNPHYVCGARVLVKPYREKSKLFDRKFLDKLEPPVCYHSHHIDMDPDLQVGWESSRLLRRQLLEEREAQLEMMHQLSQLHLGRRPSPNQPYFDSLEDQKVVEDRSKFQSPKHIPHMFDHAGANYTEQQNNEGGLNLPDNPFASPMGGSKNSKTHM